MEHHIYGSQSGNNSLNVGVGDFDFRGAHVNINGGRPIFTPEQIVIERHPKFGGRIVKSEHLSIFSIVTGIASIVGFYFTLFPASPQVKYSSWPTFFIFLFCLALLCLVAPKILSRSKFEHFLFRTYYLEIGTRGGFYLSSFTAKCPWCGSKMNLRNIGARNEPREDRFICERNPKQHTIDLDPTVLSEIIE